MAKSKTSFKKGRSGNPRGRPKKDYDAQALVAKHTQDGKALVDFWLRVMSEETALDIATGVVVGPTWKDKLEASQRLAERLWGKPPENFKVATEHTGKDGGPIEQEHRIVLDLTD
jgi:hypothetical protein